MLERDLDGATIIRMLLAERGTRGQVPVMGMSSLRVAKAVLGIVPITTKDRTHYWQIPEDWPARVARAGIDPATWRVVDLDKWLIAVKATEQARELKMQERARRDVREGLREATAKYRPPAVPRPSELIRNHVMTGRIVKELRRDNDST